MIRVEGIDYSRASVLGICEEMIVLREEALKQNQMGYAVSLSWVIAYLQEYAEILEHPNKYLVLVDLGK